MVNYKPKISVIVTTYNKERELELVLAGFHHQTFNNFELIVADDGSGPKTKEIIDAATQRAPFPIIHSWQEDLGFRAARSRNLAISKAQGDLVIMIDGDCIPLPNFLETHLTNYQPHHYIAGERYLLSQEQSSTITRESIEQNRASYLTSLIPNNEQKRLASIRRKNKFYRALNLKIRPKVMTCNFVAAHSDLKKINGFDERYVGWGHEDTDLGRRLRHIGIKSVNELANACVLHLWHKTESSFAGRVRDCKNADYFNRGFFLTNCRNGLVQRQYQDLNIAMDAPQNLKEIAQNILIPQGISPNPEIFLALASQQGSPETIPNVEIPVLIVESGLTNLPKKLLKSTRILIAQQSTKDKFPAFNGTFINIEGTQLNKIIFESIRNIIDEII